MIGQNNQGDTLIFAYDYSGIVGFKYNGVEYIYKKNIQGDVIGIIRVDSNQLVASYVYDAWGNHIVLDANGSEVTSHSHIGFINPFRYRSYYYDDETGFYYLKSRYYDPQTCRFISVDNLNYLNPSVANGLNLWVYCLNNPIMMIDPDGDMPTWLKWLIGALIIAAAVAVTIVTYGAAGVAIAGFLGVSAATLQTIAVGALIGGAVGATVGLFSGGLTYNEGSFSWDWDAAADGFMWGSITGTVSGAIGGALGNVGHSLTKFGAFGKMAYYGIQGLINSGVSSALTFGQDLIKGSLSFSNIAISAIFGFFGGVAGATKFASKALGNSIVATGLGLAEGIIDEIIEWLNSKSSYNQLSLMPSY